MRHSIWETWKLQQYVLGCGEASCSESMASPVPARGILWIASSLRQLQVHSPAPKALLAEPAGGAMGHVIGGTAGKRKIA